MKKIFIVPFVLLLLLSTYHLSAQFNLQAGVSAVVSRTKGIGGEITGNFPLKHNFSLGIGTRPIKFEEHRNLYLPVYASVKYYYPLSGSRLFASIDPGYGFYSSENVLDGSFDFRRTGAIYLSGGIGIMGNSRVSPYASVHFTKFGFTEQYGIFSQYRPISTFAFTVGLTINKAAPASVVVNKPEKLPVLHTQEYYSQTSKRQKATGWILMGSGITLITTGIIIASNKQEGEAEAAIPLVFISGSGIVTSLVSIPFFIAAAQNKKRAAAISPTVELQQAPAKPYPGSAYKRFPALGVKLDF